MEASIILVGTELLSGMTVDTNSLYMAEELNKYGIEILSKTVVRDDIEEIVDAITRSKKKTDLVILSGGLGPTIDDITKDAIAKYLDVELIVEADEYAELERKFRERGIKLLSNNKKEVEKPMGSLSFKNDVGMAPSIYIDGIAAFPGVPRELYNMFPKFLEYYAREKNRTDEMIIRDLLVWGIPESHLDDNLKDFFTVEGIHYEFLVKDYGIIIRLQSRSSSGSIVNEIADKIYARIGDNIFGEGDERLETLIIKKLLESNETISLAESCTGGAITSSLIDVPGVSKVLTEGIVCYSNESKMQRLGVKRETLEKYGAVSEQTAREMLEGQVADVAIATTGIAGPGGGSEEKPVGTVYIGIKIKNEVHIKKYNFKGTRERIRRATVMNTLFRLLKILDTRGDI